MQLIKLSPPNKGVEINTANVSVIHEEKGGAAFTVFMTSGHRYVVTKAEATDIRKWVNKE